MTTLFIADLHLRSEEPRITAGFLHFLHNEASAADALYILGDLFEAWIGDTDPNPLNRKIASAIKTLVNSGVPCYFIHGNHDFLIGRHFARESGMILLSEEQVIELYNRKILIMHGDTLCTNDIKYQNFRNRVHIPWIQKIFLALPLCIRKRVAKKILNDSKSANNKKSSSIMEVNPQTIIKIMEKYKVQWLIYGHTHCPHIYKFIANGEPAFRIVLGAWYKCGTGSIVKVTPDRFELLSFNF